MHEKIDNTLLKELKEEFGYSLSVLSQFRNRKHKIFEYLEFIDYNIGYNFDEKVDNIKIINEGGDK